MAIYTTDTYEILSIMNIFKTKTDNVTTFKTAIIYVQPLPIEVNTYIIPADIPKNYGLIQDDYDVYDRFVANVIPLFETECLPYFKNTNDGIWSSANSAISPVSMVTNSATL
jgi:hypothetical protein